MLSSGGIKKIGRELVELEQNPPDGVRICLNDQDISQLDAYIEGPEGTPYANGIFHIHIQISQDYPQNPPKCRFHTPIFHPNVGRDGEICVNTLKKDWRREFGIKHILLTIKCLLIAPNAESALNEDAGKLLLEAYEVFSQRAQRMTSIHASNKQQQVSPTAEEAKTCKDETSSGVENTAPLSQVTPPVVKQGQSVKKKNLTLRRL